MGFTISTYEVFESISAHFNPLRCHYIFKIMAFTKNMDALLSNVHAWALIKIVLI